MRNNENMRRCYRRLISVGNCVSEFAKHELHFCFVEITVVIMSNNVENKQVGVSFEEWVMWIYWNESKMLKYCLWLACINLLKLAWICLNIIEWVDNPLTAKNMEVSIIFMIIIVFRMYSWMKICIVWNSYIKFNNIPSWNTMSSFLEPAVEVLNDHIPSLWLTFILLWCYYWSIVCIQKYLAGSYVIR